MLSILSYIPQITIVLPVVGQINLTPYIAATIAFILLTLAFWVLQAVILRHLTNLSKRTATDFDDVAIATVNSVRPSVYMLVSLYFALQMLTLSVLVDKIITGLFLLVIVWQAIEVISTITDHAARKLLEKDEDDDGEVDPNSANASHMVALLVKLALWILGGIFILSNLGIEVTSLVAGLGIGGLAVAFALQGILSDLFSSFSLYFDKPFRIGDYIVIGEHSGTVEKIGVKTTRIRTLQGEELVVSNAELTSTRVQNFKRMQERRIVFTFGITYETAPEKVEGVNDIVKEVIRSVTAVRLDRVHFTSFGDSALIFEVVYYVNSADYTEYLDANQQINQGLLRQFTAAGIEFAYPTQTIYNKQV